MVEGTSMKTLVTFHDRYLSKARDNRVVIAPIRGKKRWCEDRKTDLEKRGVV